MKKFKFEVTLSEEDLNGSEFWEECMEQEDGGAEMIRQTLQDAIEYYSLLLDSDPVEAVRFIKMEEDETNS